MWNFINHHMILRSTRTTTRFFYLYLSLLILHFISVSLTVILSPYISFSVTLCLHLLSLSPPPRYFLWFLFLFLSPQPQALRVWRLGCTTQQWIWNKSVGYTLSNTTAVRSVLPGCLSVHSSQSVAVRCSPSCSSAPTRDRVQHCEIYCSVK